MNKRYILILSLIVVILSMSCVSAGLFDGLFGESDNDKNITLIKESTSGLCTFYDNGEIHAVYNVEGVLKDLPEDIDGYDLQFSFYDENGKLIKEQSALSMKFIAEHSKDSDPVDLATISVNEYKNVSFVILKLLNDDGIVVFENNVTFNMDNVETDTYHVKDSSTDSDEDDDVMDYDELNEWVFNNDDGYWDKA